MSKKNNRQKSKRKKSAARKRSATPKPLQQSSKDLTIDFKDATFMYASGRYKDLADWFLQSITKLAPLMGADLEPGSEEYQGQQRFLDRLAETLLFFFTKADFEIPRALAKKFVQANPLITSIIALSNFQTSDPQIRMLLNYPNSLDKILPLYSPRNTVKLDRRWLFDQDPELASAWYASYYNTHLCASNQTCYDNIREHQSYIDERLTITDTSGPAFLFSSPYVDSQTQRPLKEHMNRSIRERFQEVKIVNAPKPGRIAVLTTRWGSGSSAVERVYGQYVRALADKYDLSLICLGRQGNPDDLFSDVRQIARQPQTGLLKGLDAITDNDFQMALFLDIGMGGESTCLANLRIAPIQVMLMGHPVSTWGSEIDYCISGSDVELKDRACENYSERLVLLPGFGAGLSMPVNYEPFQVTRDEDEDRVIIASAWNAQKCNYPMLKVLKKILQTSKRRIVFKFIPAFNMLCTIALFRRDVQDVLGEENCDVKASGHVVTGENTYMQELERTDFSVDSYPFGGGNSIIDALYVGNPMVAWEGDECFGRYASCILKRLGLEELVATSEQQYIDSVCRLAENADYRQQLSERIKQLDIYSQANDVNGPQNFRKAIDLLIANHESFSQDGSREPIVIEPA